MAWQVLAMWVIVIAAIVWFVRDEKQRRANLLYAKAVRFAYAPHYRRPPVADDVPPPLPTPNTHALVSADRAFFKRYLQTRD